MDDQNRNLLLATALSFLVIVIWFLLFPPEEPAPPPEPCACRHQDGCKYPSSLHAGPKPRQRIVEKPTIQR